MRGLRACEFVLSGGILQCVGLWAVCSCICSTARLKFPRTSISSGRSIPRPEKFQIRCGVERFFTSPLARRPFLIHQFFVCNQTPDRPPPLGQLLVLFMIHAKRSYGEKYDRRANRRLMEVLIYIVDHTCVSFFLRCRPRSLTLFPCDGIYVIGLAIQHEQNHLEEECIRCIRCVRCIK